jgi:chromosome partitioning protein
VKIVAVANQKGGVGKTTVAIQLAAHLSRRFRTLVVDVDPQGSTTWWAENMAEHIPFDFSDDHDPAVLTRLRELDTAYDLVVVDTPGSLEDTRTLEAVLDAADYVIVPVVPEPMAIHPTLRTITQLIEPRRLPYRVLLNRVDGRIPNQYRQWQAALTKTFEVPTFHAYLRQYVIHAHAPMLGRLVTNLTDSRRTEGSIWDITRVGFELTEYLGADLHRR